MAAALITAATVALVAWSAFYLLRRLFARLSRRHRCPSCCQGCPHPCASFFSREKGSEKEL